MKVTLAAQVMSYTVAAGIYTLVSYGVFSSEYMPMAVFVEDVDKLFYSFNSVKHVHLARHSIAHLVTTVPI